MTARISQSSERVILLSEDARHNRAMQVYQRVLLGEPREGGPFLNQTFSSTLVQVEAPPRPVLLSGSYQQVLIIDPSRTRSVGTNQSALVTVEAPNVETRSVSSVQTALALSNAPVSPLDVITYGVVNTVLVVTESGASATRSSGTAQGALLQTEHPSVHLKSNVLSLVQKTLIIDEIRPSGLITSVTNLALVNTESPPPNPERLAAAAQLSATVHNVADPSVIIPTYSTAQVVTATVSSAAFEFPQSESQVTSAGVLAAESIAFASDVVQSDSQVGLIGVLSGSLTTPQDPSTIQSDAQISAIGVLAGEVVEMDSPSAIMSDSRTAQVSIITPHSTQMPNPNGIQSVNRMIGTASLVSIVREYPERVVSMVRVKTNAFLSGRKTVWRHPDDIHSEAKVSSLQINSAAPWTSLRDPAVIRPDSRVMHVSALASYSVDYGWPTSDTYMQQLAAVTAADTEKQDPEEIDGDIRLVYGAVTLVACNTTMYDDPTETVPKSRRNYNLMHGLAPA